MDLLNASVTARESAGEPYILVALSGEADVTNSDQLRNLLDGEVAKQPSHLVVDLAGVSFMDSSALHALLRANRALDRQGGVLSLVAPQEAVARMLSLTAADRIVPVYGSVEEAATG